MRPGHTLPELAIVLLLLGIAGTALLPSARAAADRVAVTAAREAVAWAVVRARSEAMLHGGAVLRLRAAGGLVGVRVSDSIVGLRRLGEDYGVSMNLGAADEAELVFDALGLGRRASRTVVLRRGGTESRLVIAAYGRAVRR